MKKRLVITGLPTPPETWAKFLGASGDQRIITMHEILAHTDSSDPKELSSYVLRELEKEKPASIVAHGMGVPLTLVALLRLKKKGVEWDTRLTIFNGVYRGMSLWRTPQPLRLQFTSMRRMIREIQTHGGVVDPRLEDYVPRIRAMYRFLILHRLADKMARALGLDYLGRFPKRAKLNLPIQIIASQNDPYLPFEAMEQLREDLEVDRFIPMEYGHFPYSLPSEKFQPLLRDFEQTV